MPNRSPLSQFIDDEIARAPLVVDEVLNRLVAGDRRTAAGPAPGSPPLLPELQRLVPIYRADVVAAFCRTLAHLLKPDRPAAEGGLRPPATLSLVEDAAVEADVELSRAVDAVRSGAEFELRELRAFTSALVGDRHVSRDTNPLRPELYVKALWSALGELPVSRTMQTAFLRCATPPLVQALRLAYAGACTRLEDAGVTAGTYRTIVTATGSRSWHRSNPPPPHLGRLRPAPPAASAAAAVADASTLLPQIFEAITRGSALARDVRALLARVQPVALRVAQQDAIALDTYTHPLWEFMDRIAFLAELHPHPGEGRTALLAQAGTLVDTLAAESTPDAASFRWALKRLTTVLQQQFDARLEAATVHIATLDTLGPSFPPTAAEDGTPLPLDATALDTVRADLLATANDTTSSTAEIDEAEAGDGRWIDAQAPGQWARLFVDGHWRPVQLLWHGDDLWLYAEVDDARQSWALRQSALERLHAEGLLRELKQRSLVRRAAARLMRDGARPAKPPTKP